MPAERHAGTDRGGLWGIATDKYELVQDICEIHEAHILWRLLVRLLVRLLIRHGSSLRIQDLQSQKASKSGFVSF